MKDQDTDNPASGDDGWTPAHADAASSDVDISIPYSNPPTDRLMAFYAEWAEQYDADLIDTYGYMAPVDAVAGLMQLGLPRDAAILDAGCGTGQVGDLLAAAGFNRIDGADLSTEMRAVAARRDSYRSLFELDMTAPYPPQMTAQNDGAPYDAVICVGVFGFGPPHVDHLPRIMDAARPGAPVLVTVNGKGWDLRGWDDSLMPTLDAAGITLHSRTRIRHMVAEGVHAELLDLRRA